VPGYAHHLFDPANEPAEWLSVTEMFTGTKPLPSVDEAGRRLRIVQTDGRYRGTPDAIKGAARQFLIGPDGTPGSATVYFIKRQGGVATTYAVTTLASETPNTALVTAALEEQRPAGFTSVFSTIAGGNFATLKATHTDFADVKAQFSTFADVRADPSVT
jgi:hypothetical protein